MAVNFCAVDTATGFVFGVQTGPSIPPAPADRLHIEITDSEKATISSKLSHDQGGEPAWRVLAGSIVANDDTRPQLDISIADTEVDEVSAVQFSMQVRDAAGVAMSFTGSRKIAVKRLGEPAKVFRLAVVNGTKAFSKLFPSGEYEIQAIGNYRLMGQTGFSVVEDI